MYVTLLKWKEYKWFRDNKKKKWKFAVKCPCHPQNHSTYHLLSRQNSFNVMRERLWNVQKWKSHVQSMKKYCFIKYANLWGSCRSGRGRPGCLTSVLFKIRWIGHQWFFSVNEYCLRSTLYWIFKPHCTRWFKLKCLWVKSWSVTIQVKASEQYSPVVLFIVCTSWL